MAEYLLIKYKNSKEWSICQSKEIIINDEDSGTLRCKGREYEVIIIKKGDLLFLYRQCSELKTKRF